MLLEGLEHTPADGPSLQHYLQGRKKNSHEFIRYRKTKYIHDNMKVFVGFMILKISGSSGH